MNFVGIGNAACGFSMASRRLCLDQSTSLQPGKYSLNYYPLCLILVDTLRDVPNFQPGYFVAPEPAVEQHAQQSPVPQSLLGGSVWCIDQQLCLFLSEPLLAQVRKSISGRGRASG